MFWERDGVELNGRQTLIEFCAKCYGIVIRQAMGLSFFDSKANPFVLSHPSITSCTKPPAAAVHMRGSPIRPSVRVIQASQSPSELPRS